MNIELMLKCYRANKARLDLLKLEEGKIMRELVELEGYNGASAVDTSREAISKTNKFSSVVENEVVSRENNCGEIQGLKSSLKEINDNIFTVMYEIGQVDALIDSLTDEQRFIVDCFFRRGFIWRLVAEEYRKEFGENMEKRTLQSIKKRAMLQMEELVKSKIARILY